MVTKVFFFFWSFTCSSDKPYPSIFVRPPVRSSYTIAITYVMDIYYEVIITVNIVILIVYYR